MDFSNIGDSASSRQRFPSCSLTTVLGQGVEIRLREALKFGQATKGVRRMPWRREAMKDVVSCEKLRGAANRL